MHVIATGSTSPYPSLPHDGGVMIIDGDGLDIVASCHIQIANLSYAEIAAMQYGKIEIGHVRINSGNMACAVFLVRAGNSVFEIPCALGLEPEAKRERLEKALSHASNLQSGASWPLTLEFVDRMTRTTKAFRVVVPSPRFWKSVAEALQASVSVTPHLQQDMLRRHAAQHSSPARLLRRAQHVEIFE